MIQYGCGTCQPRKNARGNSSVRCVSAHNCVAYNSEAAGCYCNPNRPSGSSSPTGSTGGTGGTGVCEGCTPESLGIFPRDAQGNYDFEQFWKNRLAEGWVYPICEANVIPNHQSYDASGNVCDWEFNHPRSGCTRCHAAIDLGAAAVGNPVLAMADGKVLFHTDNFYDVTGSVVIVHETADGTPVVVRYAEFEPDVTDGAEVHKGDVIGYMEANTFNPNGSIGYLIQWMLHTEVYFGANADGTLIPLPTGSSDLGSCAGDNYIYVTAACPAICGGNVQFQRRCDLIDPMNIELLKANYWTGAPC
jgi:murein DD-endopeptidase MepM/ murein hydrolase activator NlpD